MMDPSVLSQFLVLVILQKNFAGLEERLNSISDPKSSFYGNHLSGSDIRQFTSPDDNTLKTFLEWIVDNGIDQRKLKWSPSRDWVILKEVALKKAEKILNTKFYNFEHETGYKIIRTETYSLPKYLHPHVDMVQFTKPDTEYSTIKKFERLSTETNKPTKFSASQNCYNPSRVTARCLRELYKTKNYVPVSANKGNKIAVTGFNDQRPFRTDVKAFLASERPEFTNATFEVVLVNGGIFTQNNTAEEIKRGVGLEASLDIQYTMALTLPTPNIFYSIGDGSPEDLSNEKTNDPVLKWLEFLWNQEDEAIPNVISTSYGSDELAAPKSYATRVCAEFAALGARGVSLIFSSGDYGVGGNGGPYCHTADDFKKPRFLSTFPASCPYVTSVGGTQNFFPEVAASRNGPAKFSSGGGFSEYFLRPSYQSKVVENYLHGIGKLHKGLYNEKGRGYPDVAAQGSRYTVFWNGKIWSMTGTSASAPTFASLISLLNDDRMSKGKKPLGFLNPWLYSEAFKGLNDIKSGNSEGCNTTGFPANVGWDPVTGFGTPNFEALLRISRKQSLAHKISFYTKKFWHKAKHSLKKTWNKISHKIVHVADKIHNIFT
ncbi:peptidase S8/S53 domain-containing protein [Phakopsora pachyrhizi]|nr:peptidase S8/S53 domain-containing protein [Phakopsora pachyrhizi]